MYLLPIRDYIVMVVVLTYNHEKFIEDALKGIVMQQTNFPVVACVLDDCSTDGTADIVRRYEAQYPDLIKGFYFEENQFSKGKSTLEALIPWLDKVKYIALCEGDDYWTDPLKLQKQVDFMENHEDCTLCIHNAIVKWEDKSKEDHLLYPLENKEYKASDFINNWIVPTASVLIRSNVFKSPFTLTALANKSFCQYDTIIWFCCASIGKVYGLKDTMCVYRRLKSGYTSDFNDRASGDPMVSFRFGIHNIATISYFGERLGSDFVKAVKSLFFTYNIDGATLSLKHRNLRLFIRFFRQSLSVSKLETVGKYLKILKWAVGRVLFKYTGISRESFKSRSKD